MDSASTTCVYLLDVVHFSNSFGTTFSSSTVLRTYALLYSKDIVQVRYSLALVERERTVLVWYFQVFSKK